MTIAQASLSASQGQRLVDEFGRLLNERFAYANANDYDYESALRALSASVGRGVRVNELGFELHRIVACFIDGHAWVEPYRLAEGALPIRLEPLGDRVVAVKADRSGFVGDHPFLTAIDGKPLEEWYSAVDQVIPVGSTAYRQRRRLLQLEHIQHWRAVMGLPLSPTVSLELADHDESRTTEVEMALAPEPLSISRWPEEGSGVLAGNVGYLRLRKMDEVAVNEIRTWMPRLVKTDGLIIDVRDNTGGSRAPLLELYSWLEPAPNAATVGSVGAYRLWSGFAPDHLDARFMFQRDDVRLTQAQAHAVARFSENFTPEAALHNSGFSDWHYLVLPHPRPADGRPESAPYDKPIMVLVNEKCFSAVDIFLGALKQLPNVRLVGRPSSGGSAFGVRHQLDGSGITTRLGSMISFDPQGRLYDTRGFEPDLPHLPVPEDFVRGRGDSTLAVALRDLAIT